MLYPFPSACVLLIGNEILSGRTQDVNLAYLAGRLNDAGIRVMESRVVPDIEERIINTVNECRANYHYVFTTGGIGPTHDDITALAVAKAFGRELVRDKKAEALLHAIYKPEDRNEARMKMADIPKGAELIDNPVSTAPGFRVENVYVLAGVPKIMQAMLAGVLPGLQGGAPMLSETVTCDLPEGRIAAALAEVQQRYDDVEIGSYPQIPRDGKFITNLVLRSVDETRLAKASNELRAALTELGSSPHRAVAGAY